MVIGGLCVSNFLHEITLIWGEYLFLRLWKNEEEHQVYAGSYSGNPPSS